METSAFCKSWKKAADIRLWSEFVDEEFRPKVADLRSRFDVVLSQAGYEGKSNLAVLQDWFQCCLITGFEREGQEPYAAIDHFRITPDPEGMAVSFQSESEKILILFEDYVNKLKTKALADPAYCGGWGVC